VRIKNSYRKWWYQAPPLPVGAPPLDVVVPTVADFGPGRGVVQQEAKRLGPWVRGSEGLGNEGVDLSGPIGGGQLSARRASGAPGQRRKPGSCSSEKENIPLSGKASGVT